MEFFVPPDEAQQWYEYWCPSASSGTSTSACPASCAAPARSRRRRAEPLLVGHGRRGVPVPLGLGRARGHRQPRRLRPHQHHATHSGERLDYFDQATNERYTPHVIEPAAGATRTMMAFLIAAYDEEEVRGETRTVLRSTRASRRTRWRCCRCRRSPSSPARPWSCWPACSRTSCATTTRPRTSASATAARTSWAPRYCITYDFDSVDDGAVTVRDRDTMEQERVPLDGIVEHVLGRLGL
jgi:glycyl-tRNA synthetase